MNELDFYKLEYDDMIDALLKIRLDLNLWYISKERLKDLAFMFKHGYTPKGLIPYIISINNKEKIQIEYDEKILRYKYKQWLDKNPDVKKENDWLWEESQRIIDNHKNGIFEETKEEINEIEEIKMNLVIISGKLVRNPESAVTANGKTYARFDLAINEFYNGTQTTTYMKVSCWEKQADFVNSFCSKGDGVLVQGKLRMFEYQVNGQKRNGIEVVASLVERLETKKANDNNTMFTYNDASNELKKETNASNLPEDDDVPF
jgi:single-strand DNA-binding protein